MSRVVTYGLKNMSRYNVSFIPSQRLQTPKDVHKSLSVSPSLSLVVTLNAYWTGYRVSWACIYRSKPPVSERDSTPKTRLPHLRAQIGSITSW